MEVHYNKYCQKCTGKVVMHAFSEGECTLCSSVISTSHTPCDKVCDKCSDDKGVCMSCGEPLRPIKLLKVDPISEEIQIAMYNEEHPDQYMSVEYIPVSEIIEEKQRLEGLIFTWRAKLKDGCQERADSLRQSSEWHEHDDEEFAIIKDTCFAPLRDFDKHFSITEQRQGHV